MGKETKLKKLLDKEIKLKKTIRKDTIRKPNTSSKLLKFFNIGIRTKDSKTKPIPMIVKDTDAGEKLIPVKMNSEIQQFYDWWIRETNDNKQSLSDRMDRYKDIDFMIKNDSVISMAADLYADETTQVDTQNQVITATSKNKKFEKWILQFLDDIGFTQHKIRQIAYSVNAFGDAFLINIIDPIKGITEVINLDVDNVEERLEFNAIEAKKSFFKQNKRYMTSVAKNNDRMTDLITKLKDSKTDLSSMFKHYLFGFVVAPDLILPPWNVSHFRLSENSEFGKWGRSNFINCIAPFRQLKASKNLMAMARASKFPKERFEIDTDENMTEIEKWNAVNEARQEYQNLTALEAVKEEFAVGGQIWTPKGLLDYSLLENRMDLGDIADIELLRDDMIMATRVPKGYLIVDRGAFGASGQSLLQQFKPFGRAVYQIQSAILQEVVQIIKIHLTITEEYDPNEPFELAMNFPVIEEASDRLRMKNDTLRLANDVISNIQNALGTRDGLPPDVIKSVFSQLSFLDPEDVDMWIDQSAESLLDEKNHVKIVNRNLSEDQTKKLTDRLNETVINTALYDAKKKNSFFEGIQKGKHYLVSYKNNFELEETLRMMDSQIIKKNSTMKG